MWVKTKNLSGSFLPVSSSWTLRPREHLRKNCVQAERVSRRFFTRTGVGTVVSEGKEIRQFHGKNYVLEESLFADISLVKAKTADRAGNLVFNLTARNFNPNVAMASRMTIVEVEELVEIGDLHPDEIHTPGIFVRRIVVNRSPNKHIEKRTTR